MLTTIRTQVQEMLAVLLAIHQLNDSVSHIPVNHRHKAQMRRFMIEKYLLKCWTNSFGVLDNASTS